MTNTSEMVCTYDWSFLEEEITSLHIQEEDESKKKKKKKKKDVPINEVFDILPVSGILLPGQTETVEFTFYAGHGMTYNGISVCSVDGGPDYQVGLVGESSFVSHRLSTYELDFGEVPYNDTVPKEFFVENVGKVPFEYNINLSTISRPGVIECHPMSGKVMNGERAKVIVRFFPGIPDNIDEIFLVECAHFPAERFKVKAVGIYPGCLMTFPRYEEEFQQRFESTKKIIDKTKNGYQAAFTARDVKMVASSKNKKEEKHTMDPFVMDVEAEADRMFLCNQILNQIDILSATQAVKGVDSDKLNRSMSTKKGMRKTVGDGDKSMITKQLDNLVISSYQCDFGNMIVGQSKKKTFRVTNVGKCPVSFNFDKKALQNAFVTIEPDKANKLLPNTSTQFNIVFSTRKNQKHLPVEFPIPVDVKQGPSYTIFVTANLTIPELSMSHDTVDFEKVCVGTRKTMKIRFINKKEVPCDWWYYFKPDVAGVSSKEGEKFTVFPTSGTLLPDQMQTVDVMFIPTHEKVISQKLLFKCKQNSKTFSLNAKGHGVNYCMELPEDHFEMGPVLPYKQIKKEFEIRNPMDFPIEIYS